MTDPRGGVQTPRARRDALCPVRLILILFFALAALYGCSAPPEHPLVRLSPRDFPEFSDDLNHTGLKVAILQSLTYLKRIPPDREFTFGPDTVDARRMIASLELFLAFLENRPTPKQVQRFIKRHYRVYGAAGEPKTRKVLFTGYFEPLLQGSLSPDATFRYPVYGVPADLATVELGAFSSKYEGQRIIGRVEGKSFVPYHDRNEIDAGVLADKAPVLAWVSDPVALFFLHIQGSGKVELPGGGVLNIHYHAKNGRPYRSIGQLLIDDGKITVAEMSMQAIRRYLKAHPEEIERVLHHNPSYIFFSIQAEGPLGAINVKLTPGRSIAVDRKIFPMAALSFVQVQKPRVAKDGSGEIVEWVDFSRFVLNQDTGGAIKGPGRADLFWGNGDYAEIAAGHMKHRGDLFVLVLKEDEPLQ